MYAPNIPSVRRESSFRRLLIIQRNGTPSPRRHARGPGVRTSSSDPVGAWQRESSGPSLTYVGARGSRDPQARLTRRCVAA